MASPADSHVALDANAEQLACFGVHGGVYAIDVRNIREVARCKPVTPLPNAPAPVVGVVDLRGALLPLLDLGRALGGAPVPATPAARIVILEVDELVFGLRVAVAGDVIAVDRGAVRSPPAAASGAGCQVVRAVVRRPDAPPVLVLSLEHLLERANGGRRSRGEGVTA